MKCSGNLMPREHIQNKININKIIIKLKNGVRFSDHPVKVIIYTG